MTLSILATTILNPNSLINYINKYCNIHKGLKTTNESHSILRHKLSVDKSAVFVFGEAKSIHAKRRFEDVLMCVLSRYVHALQVIGIKLQ